jgi:hypothetical protein
MTDSRAQEILREALAIASGQKSGTTTAETEHIRAIGRHSADLLHALIWLEEEASISWSDAEKGWVADARKPALEFARKVIHAAGGLTVAEETQLNLGTHRHRDPVEERLDEEADPHNEVPA